MLQEKGKEDEELCQLPFETVETLPRIGELLTLEIYAKSRGNEYHEHVPLYKVVNVEHEIFQNKEPRIFNGQWFHFIYIILEKEKEK